MPWGIAGFAKPINILKKTLFAKKNLYLKKKTLIKQGSNKTRADWKIWVVVSVVVVVVVAVVVVVVVVEVVVVVVERSSSRDSISQRKFRSRTSDNMDS